MAPLPGEGYRLSRVYSKGMIIRAIFIVVLTGVLSSPVIGGKSRESFFGHQRRGANYFNKTPREQWFADAAAARIDWCG